jgi:hypothetical protein
MAASPALAAQNQPTNCGSEPCSTRVGVKGTGIIPPPDEFALRGDIFSNSFTDIALGGNLSREINLGFTVNFGFGPVSSLFINENGAVSFLRPLSALAGGTATAGLQAQATTTGGFRNVTSLSELGVPVIAPFYADLISGSGAGNGRLDIGDIVVQYGLADPYADGGSYSERDARQAVRITWYGLNVDTGAAAAASTSNPVYAQLLLSSDLNGLDNFEFRYGTLDNPGQDGMGSIAGFSLGGNTQQFSGPYQNGSPLFFEFKDGVYIGQSVASVPEPATWLEMIAGFGLFGMVLRRRVTTAASAA